MISFLKKFDLSAGTVWGLEAGHSQYPDIGSGSEGETEYCKENVDLFPKIYDHFSGFRPTDAESGD